MHGVPCGGVRMAVITQTEARREIRCIALAALRNPLIQCPFPSPHRALDAKVHCACDEQECADPVLHDRVLDTTILQLCVSLPQQRLDASAILLQRDVFHMASMQRRRI